MGTRGPKPMPLSIVRKHGSPATKSRRKNATEVRPGKPKCPNFLDNTAKYEWQRITQLLYEQGTISKLDKAILAEYCQAWSLWKKAVILVEEKGVSLTYTTDKGYEGQIPEIAILSKAAERMNRAMDKLGLTPSARSGLNNNNGGGDGAEGLFD